MNKDSIILSNYDLNIRGYNGWTPLQIAARRGYVDILNLLIENGCNIHTKDDDGQNLIFSCALYGNSECFEILYKLGVNIIEKDLYGNSPISVASLNGHINILKLYKKYDCLMNEKCKMGTPLINAIKNNKIECINYLKSIGCN